MRTAVSRDILVIVEEGGHDRHETRCAVLSPRDFSRLMVASWRLRAFTGRDPGLPNVTLAIRVRGKVLVDYYEDTDEKPEFVDELVQRYRAYRPSPHMLAFVRRQKRRERVEAMLEEEEQVDE